jgi:effector-binding domain-containing protein
MSYIHIKATKVGNKQNKNIKMIQMRKLLRTVHKRVEEVSLEYIRILQIIKQECDLMAVLSVWLTGRNH